VAAPAGCGRGGRDDGHSDDREGIAMKRLKRAHRNRAHRLTARRHRKATQPRQKGQTFFTGGKCRF
jgi:hypothetical protein